MGNEKLVITTGYSSSSAFVAAFLIAIDNASIILGRIIILDAQLVFYCTASILCAAKLYNSSRYSHVLHLAVKQF